MSLDERYEYIVDDTWGQDELLDDGGEGYGYDYFEEDEGFIEDYNIVDDDYEITVENIQVPTFVVEFSADYGTPVWALLDEVSAYLEERNFKDVNIISITTLYEDDGLVLTLVYNI